MKGTVSQTVQGDRSITGTSSGTSGSTDVSGAGASSPSRASRVPPVSTTLALWAALFRWACSLAEREKVRVHRSHTYLERPGGKQLFFFV